MTTTPAPIATSADVDAAFGDYILTTRWARVFGQRWPAATDAQKNYLRRLLASSADAVLVALLRERFNGIREDGGTITGPEVSAAIHLLTR